MGKFRLNLNKFIIFPIVFYQKVVSPCLPSKCRFYPSCSQYAREAIDQYGLVQGLWMMFHRLFRCHPWHAGGFDPVPKKERI
jgi:putative membrane protein insertion efficiency factor